MRKGSCFICENCAYESLKWLGKCPSCGAWNSFVEQSGPARRRPVVQLRCRLALRRWFLPPRNLVRSNVW